MSSRINGVVSVSAYVRMTTMAIRKRSRVSYFGRIFTWESDVLQVFTASVFTHEKKISCKLQEEKTGLIYNRGFSIFSLHPATLNPRLVANSFNDTQNVNIKQCCQGAFSNIVPATLFNLTPKLFFNIIL